MTDFTTDRVIPARVLAISAHPDDSELQAGGTLAKWSAAGCQVSIVVCTDGSKGTWNPDANLAELVATRQSEQRDAAAALGANGTVGFCGWVDGELVQSPANVRTLTQWIRRLRPTVVISHDPWKRYRLHPDHRAAGFLVSDAVVAARDPHFFPEMEYPHHRPDEVWYFEADEPNHVEAIDGWIETKIHSLEQHVSQHESTMGIASDKDAAGHSQFVADIHGAAVRSGALVGIDAGESFYRLTDV
ncbi:MAG: LmbE family N-acetylglucosaminyl deacetylase [Paracrocinitomix sp.]|jgi:LmbE family N-acetylglucosaminyl deacetylase